ncbi:MAG: hypothetical protein ACPL7K_09085 [Armatimonadota bacterium]
MLLGTVTYNMLKEWSLEEILQKLPELGFEAMELRTTLMELSRRSDLKSVSV